MTYQSLWGHALAVTAIVLGIVGMGTTFNAISNGNLPELGIGVPALFIGLWWAGRDLGRSILASKSRSAHRPG